VKTHEGDLAARLDVTDGGVRFELAGRALPVIQIPPGLVDWKLSFENGVFTAPFGGNLRNSDTARSPHVLYAVLKLRGDRLTGYVLAAAIDRKFTLPYWVELRKSTAP
jgi:hypothetical protein